MIDFTTLVAIDVQHEKELRLVLPTWQRHRPEIFRQPFVLLVDEAGGSELIDRGRELLAGHPALDVAAVPDVFGIGQREKMLSALTLIGPFLAGTPWILKLDTDAPAMRSNSDWAAESLIADDTLIPGETAGRKCVFCASPWGYTKPAAWLKTLDDWGDTVPALKDKPRLNLPVTPGSKIVSTPGRIISYVFFGRTSWMRWTAGLSRTLPVPSQDTFAYYCAKRNGDFFRRVKMKNLGWDHVRARNLPAACTEAMK